MTDAEINELARRGLFHVYADTARDSEWFEQPVGRDYYTFWQLVALSEGVYRG